MSVTARYDNVLVALCQTPPFKRLKQMIHEENHTEPITPNGETQRALAVKYCQTEFRKILKAMLEYERAMQANP